MFPLDKKTKYVKIKKSVNFFVYYFVVFNGLFFFYELFLLNLKYMNMKKKMILSVTASFALFSTAACAVGTSIADPAKQMLPAYAAIVSVFPSRPGKREKALTRLGRDDFGKTAQNQGSASDLPEKEKMVISEAEKKCPLS